MNLKKTILYIWNDLICERTNRKALKRFYLANKLWHTNLLFFQFISMIIHSKNIKKYNCQIYPQATIGKNLYIPHCIGIVIGNTSVLGDNCVIFPNVVIGAAYSPNKEKCTGRRHAIIGNNCTIGANSSIIGDIVIGNNVVIGANSIITKDIPDNAIVINNNKIIGYKK